MVGAGIAGLTAAHRLADDHEVLVLEGAPEVGGKLRRASVGGVAVDVGAEAMLHRRPEGTDLARELGLDVVNPATTSSAVWSRGGLHPLPRTLLGVPLDVDGLAASGLLDDDAMAVVRREPGLPPSDLASDRSVASLVGERLGPQVVDRLVEPLLGGVYAGHATLLSLRATAPQLAALAERGSVLEAAAALPVSDGPVFAGLPGGLATLPEALVGTGRFDVRTSAAVRALELTGDGFVLTVGSAHAAERVTADRVVLACPASPASRLLGDLAPVAARELAAIEYASMAIVTHAFRAADLGELAATGGSGFLVPPVEGRQVKAATWSFAKWDWVREAGDGLLLLRTSAGRHREAATLQRPDAALVADSLADLATLAGVGATPVDSHVQRWGGALPQYAVGHLDRVARIRSEVARVPGLSVCGAAYDGVGIPAVIASAGHATMNP